MKSCRYHPLYGARLFDEDELPQTRYGWFDTPTAANKAKEHLTSWMRLPEERTIVPKPKTKEQLKKMAMRSRDPGFPDPMNFKNIDAYLLEFKSLLSTDLSGFQIEERCRRAIDHFGAVRYTTRFAGRRSSSIDMVNRAHQLEHQHRIIPPRKFPDLAVEE